jgi:hypothetical protein
MNKATLMEVVLPVTCAVVGSAGVLTLAYGIERRSREQTALLEEAAQCKSKLEDSHRREKDCEADLKSTEEMAQDVWELERLCSGDGQWEYCPGYCNDLEEGVQQLEASHWNCSLALRRCQQNYNARTHAGAVMDGVAHDCAADVEREAADRKRCEDALARLSLCQEPTKKAVKR